MLEDTLTLYILTPGPRVVSVDEVGAASDGQAIIAMNVDLLKTCIHQEDTVARHSLVHWFVCLFFWGVGYF